MGNWMDTIWESSFMVWIMTTKASYQNGNEEENRSHVTWIMSTKYTRKRNKRHSLTTNLLMRYCKMVAKSESWSELSSDRDRESLSSILLEVEVPIKTKINEHLNKKKLIHSWNAKQSPCYLNHNLLPKVKLMSHSWVCISKQK